MRKLPRILHRVHFFSSWVYKFIACIRTNNMRAHGVKQKPPVCVRACMCADHEYVRVFLRKIRACPFCPARLVCACKIKGCRPLSSSFPPLHIRTHMRFLSFLSCSFSFYSLVSLYSCIRRLRDHVLCFVSPTPPSFLLKVYGISTRCNRVCVTFISGCRHNFFVVTLITYFSKSYAIPS